MGRGPASVSICYLGLGNPEDLTPARTVIYLADAPEFLKLSTATQEFQWSLGSFVASASKAALISAAVIERGTIRRGCCRYTRSGSRLRQIVLLPLSVSSAAPRLARPRRPRLMARKQ